LSFSCTKSHDPCIWACNSTLFVSTSLFSGADFFEYGSWSIKTRISSHLTTASSHHIGTYIRHNSFIDDRVSNTPQQSNMQQSYLINVISMDLWILTATWYHHHLNRCLCVQADQIGHSCRSTCFKVLYSCTKSTVKNAISDVQNDNPLNFCSRKSKFKLPVGDCFVRHRNLEICFSNMPDHNFGYRSYCTFHWMIPVVVLQVTRDVETLGSTLLLRPTNNKSSPKNCLPLTSNWSSLWNKVYLLIVQFILWNGTVFSLSCLFIIISQTNVMGGGTAAYGVDFAACSSLSPRRLRLREGAIPSFEPQICKLFQRFL